jgi:hypothetical protein
MSNIPSTKSDWITPPISNGVADSNVLRFTANTGAGWPRADALPKSWQGAYVTLRVTGCDLYFFFSRNATVLPDVSIAKANDGAGAPLLGWLLKDSETMDVTIPRYDDSANGPLTDIYFCRAGDAAGEVWMLRSSDA